MSHFKRTDPELRELVPYVIDRALDREAVLTKTKLVKLIYLIDLETFRAERRLLTALKWRFYHYGPYAFELEPVLKQLEGHQIEWKEFPPSQLESTILYTKVWQAPPGSNWRVLTKMRIDRIVDRWADEALELLLDFVYFETEPMQHAVRGEMLDFDWVSPPAAIEPSPEPARLNEEIRKRLREVVAEERTRREALTSRREPRYDDVWEEAMAVERSLDEEVPDMTGAILAFSDEAAGLFASAVDE
jgi:hypothetical protein